MRVAQAQGGETGGRTRAEKKALGSQGGVRVQSHNLVPISEAGRNICSLAGSVEDQSLLCFELVASLAPFLSAVASVTVGYAPVCTVLTLHRSRP